MAYDKGMEECEIAYPAKIQTEDVGERLFCPGCGLDLPPTVLGYAKHVEGCPLATKEENRRARFISHYTWRPGRRDERDVLLLSLATGTKWGSA